MHQVGLTARRRPRHYSRLPGGLFQLALDKHFVASRVQQRCSLLWEQIQLWYAEVHAGGRLTSLVATMIKKRGAASPKLRASGAQARQLVPFALRLATMMDPGDPEVEAARACAFHLDACYMCLSLEGGPAHLQEHSIRIASQWVALEKGVPAAVALQAQTAHVPGALFPEF